VLYTERCLKWYTNFAADKLHIAVQWCVLWVLRRYWRIVAMIRINRQFMWISIFYVSTLISFLSFVSICPVRASLQHRRLIWRWPWWHFTFPTTTSTYFDVSLIVRHLCNSQSNQPWRFYQGESTTDVSFNEVFSLVIFCSSTSVIVPCDQSLQDLSMKWKGH